MKIYFAMILGIFLISITSCERTAYSEKLPTEGFIIRDNVKVHAKTNEKSTVVGTLELHDRIEMLARLEIPNPASTKDMPWSEVWYKIHSNTIEGYILACCLDKEKHTYTINGNSIVVYPKLADGFFDNRGHNPYWLMGRFPVCLIFINDRCIRLPESIRSGWFLEGKIIDNNLHLIFEYSKNAPVIINVENGKIHIGTVNNKQYLSMEGDFIIDKDEMLYAYYGKEGDVIVPEKIAGINVRAIGEYVFWNKNYKRIDLPSSIRDIKDADNIPVIIIGNGVDIESSYYGFADAYNRNGKKGGIYIRNDKYIWIYNP
jgi:hypothetical protein